MGKMKEQFMKEREATVNAMHDIAKNPYNNQLNNNEMAKKTMQEKLRKQPEPVQETRKEVLTRLYIENGLVREDVHKDPRGFSTLKRTGIDKIASRNGITVGYEVILLDVEKGECVLKAAATMKVGNEVRNMMDFGEASVNNNLTGGGKKWLVSMAKKRAMARVVLSLTGFYEQGMYSKDEMSFEEETDGVAHGESGK
tara:strand:+ start:45 stop:638 length:594 start_codon:yes stop_codon:yes gene_type:complete